MAASSCIDPATAMALPLTNDQHSAACGRMQNDLPPPPLLCSCWQELNEWKSLHAALQAQQDAKEAELGQLQEKAHQVGRVRAWGIGHSGLPSACNTTCRCALGSGLQCWDQLHLAGSGRSQPLLSHSPWARGEWRAAQGVHAMRVGVRHAISCLCIHMHMCAHLLVLSCVCNTAGGGADGAQGSRCRGIGHGGLPSACLAAPMPCTWHRCALQRNLPLCPGLQRWDQLHLAWSGRSHTLLSHGYWGQRGVAGSTGHVRYACWRALQVHMLAVAEPGREAAARGAEGPSRTDEAAAAGGAEASSSYESSDGHTVRCFLAIV